MVFQNIQEKLEKGVCAKIICFWYLSVQFLNYFFCYCLGTCLIMARLDQRVPQPCLQLCHQLRFELNYPMFFKKDKKKIMKSWKKFYETSAWQIAQSWWLDTQLFKQKNRADTPQWSQILFKVFFYFSTILEFTSFLTTVDDQNSGVICFD